MISAKKLILSIETTLRTLPLTKNSLKSSSPSILEKIPKLFIGDFTLHIHNFFSHAQFRPNAKYLPTARLILLILLLIKWVLIVQTDVLSPVK